MGPRFDGQVALILALILYGLLIISMSAVVVRKGYAQPQHDHSQMGVAGEFYSKWQRPQFRDAAGKRQNSCCSDKDCAVRPIRKVNGMWQFFYAPTNAWITIPQELLEHNQPDPEESPDGQSHVCYLPPASGSEGESQGQVLCAVLGGGQ